MGTFATPIGTEVKQVKVTITNSIFTFLAGHLPVTVQGRLMKVESQARMHPVTGEVLFMTSDYYYVLVRDSEFDKHPLIGRVVGVRDDYEWVFHMNEVEVEDL